MASSINASTSGAGGLISTADSSGVLDIQTAGTTAISVDASQNVTLTNVLPQASGGTGTTIGYNGFKNRIINGAMMIDQRNAGASVTPTTSEYVLDRWRASMSQSSKFSVQQSSTSPVGFNNSLLITSLSSYSVLTGDFFNIQQRIEGFNVADLGWGTANAQTVTVSFWVRSSLTGTFGGSVNNSVIDRSYPFSYTINSADTWELKTVTIAGDTSGTWNTTNGNGIRLGFSLGYGSTYGNGTAGAWVSGDVESVTGATSVVGTSGATWYVTGVQLEKGSTATSFDYRPYGTELQLCQRYYELSYNQGVAIGTASNTGGQNCSGVSVNDIASTTYYKVTKRTSPTITPYSPATGTANAIRNYTSGADVTSVSTEVSDSGFRVYKASSITSGNYYAYQWTASAEL